MEEILLTALCTIIIGLFGYIGGKLINVLEKIQTSIEKLNIQIAVVIERTNSHEKRIEVLEEKTNA